jgi:hypothetical protein
MTSYKQLFTDAALKAGIIAGTLDATAASIQYYLLTEKIRLWYLNMLQVLLLEIRLIPRAPYLAGQL